MSVEYGYEFDSFPNNLTPQQISPATPASEIRLNTEKQNNYFALTTRADILVGVFDVSVVRSRTFCNFQTHKRLA